MILFLDVCTSTRLPRSVLGIKLFDIFTAFFVYLFIVLLVGDLKVVLSVFGVVEDK